MLVSSSSRQLPLAVLWCIADCFDLSGDKCKAKDRLPVEVQVKTSSASPISDTEEIAGTHPENTPSESVKMPGIQDSPCIFPSLDPLSFSPSRPHYLPELETTLSTIREDLKGIGGLGSGFLSGPSCEAAFYRPFTKLLATDPIFTIDRKTAAKLIHQWCDGVGLLYPILDRQMTLCKADDILITLQHARDSGVQLPWAKVIETLFDAETNKLKLILAISRTLESEGRDEQAQKLFQSVTETMESLICSSSSINNIQILLLMVSCLDPSDSSTTLMIQKALYHYQIDDEVLSGRAAASAARLCLEMGLHRRSTLEAAFPNDGLQSAALETFWSVYMFERRICLGQGVPFIIQDAYIDRSLFPQLGHSTQQPPSSAPVSPQDCSNSILSAHLQLAVLCGKSWHALTNLGDTGLEPNLDSLSYLDYQIKQWYERLPRDVRLNKLMDQPYDGQSMGFHVQGFLYFQHIQLRNSIYRHILQSGKVIEHHALYTQTATKLAHETIQTLAHLNEKTTYVRTLPVFFKHPLLTALLNLLSVLVDGGSANWGDHSDEVGLAISIFEALGTRSAPVMQLWESNKGLHKLQDFLYASFSDDISAGWMTPDEMLF